MPINENSILALNPFDIGRIEILKSAASASIYGGRAGNGVIALYTRTGTDYQYMESLPGRYIIIHRAGGYSKVREFYSPQYGESDPAHQFPDLRTTLYWNPSVQTDEKGIAVLSFFAADRNTSYRAVVEGVSPDGFTGRSEMNFGVKREEVSP
jgi:TonB-dependent SusC/RagA subfamily outer membrane receptor